MDPLISTALIYPTQAYVEFKETRQGVEEIPIPKLYVGKNMEGRVGHVHVRLSNKELTLLTKMND